MRTIIAPTDFSPVSLNSVNYAADMAVAINAELLLLHVVQIPATAIEVPLTEMEYQEMTEDAAEKLAKLADYLCMRTKEKINIHIKSIMGSVEHELKEICKHKEPYLVVMGTKGAGAAERFFMGSKTLFSVTHLQRPVLVIPQNSSFKGIKKIALASDLKESKETVLIKFLKEWLINFHATLDIINVSEPDNIKADIVSGSISLQNLLNEFHPQFHFIDKENVEEGVYEFVKQANSDLLIVIPKKHGFFGALFHKSQSKKFILHPQIPILAISE